MKPSVLTLIAVLVLITSSCSQPSPPVAPSRWQPLLAYIPFQWADSHPKAVLGTVIVFLDMARMRQDLGLASVTGADSREAKLPLLTALNTQGVDLTVRDATFFNQWGWDIADVEQVLLIGFPAGTMSVNLGSFGRPEIRRHLLDRGYQERQFEGFTIFALENGKDQFAFRGNDTLIWGASVSELEFLIRQGAGGQQNAGQHPAMGELLKHLEGAWGAFVAPGGDGQAFSDYIGRDMVTPPEVSARLYDFNNQASDEFYKFGKPNQSLQFGWDLMAVGFWGAKEDPTTLSFLYHYLSEEQARKDVTLVQKILTDMPYISGGRTQKTWKDVVSLQGVQVRGTVLKATATTRNKSLIGFCLANRDFFGFLPVRVLSK